MAKVKFEVGKIYSCGKYIMHTPLKFLKVIEREDEAVLLEDLTGRKFYQRVFFDKSYSNELIRNAEVIYAHPYTYSAIDEVTESEWKFVAENLDAMYPPAEVTLERVLEFFADYIKVEPPLIEKLKAKVAEQKNKPRQSIIDWSVIQADNAIEELKALQKDFKHLVEVSKMVQAEKLFEEIKSCLKKYRTQIAV